MKLNTKVRYGLRAIIEIGCHEHGVGVFQKEIAKNQRLSEKYLDPIISALKANGLIRNMGGKKSGYVLNKPASKIRVLDVYNAFESGPVLVPCIDDPRSCWRHKKCAAKEYWCGLNEVVMKYMSKTTIDSLVKRCKDLHKKK